ncbi:DUF998 domain-containing protein [Notoacmeibacter sp. MSK16QG-6]|uniref:DUF998 domain-containing protein n=1 Tax=Notoacmeibacter sp. MSK16QG-6 TaxID=2957982 RepID=UPI0020A09F3C|nr:DUF998 domain-containing protein [Notoacmeibacter sp. MSK16QG-6]MCP1199910.1 DUF998 domain-containing protein [Notoacmeibacter sp. MSK16QG-6]
MSSDNNAKRGTRTLTSPLVLETIGWIVLVCCLLVVCTDLILGFFLQPNYSPISDTISDLAAGGRYAKWQDLAMEAFAISIVLTGIGLLMARRTGGRWIAGAAAMVVTGILVFFIAKRDEYGDLDKGGLVLHYWMVYAMAALVPASLLLLRKDIAHRSDRTRAILILFAALTILWIVGSPIFYFMDTAYDGLIERALAAVMIVWIAVCARSLTKERRLDEDGGDD